METTHRIYQGDGASIKVPLLVDGVPATVAGWSWVFVVYTGGDIANAIITLTSGAGEIVPFDGTSVEVVIPPAASIGKNIGRHQFAVRGTNPSGVPQTTEVGVFYIDAPKRAAA